MFIYVNPQMVTNTVWLWGVPKWEFFLSPSPYPYGDSPYGYGDCVFSHPFSHALKNIFFARASKYSLAPRANIPFYHTIATLACGIISMQSYCLLAFIIALPFGDHTEIPVLLSNLSLLPKRENQANIQSKQIKQTYHTTIFMQSERFKITYEASN